MKQLIRPFILMVLLASCSKEDANLETKALESDKPEKMVKSVASLPVTLLDDSSFQSGFSVLHPTSGSVQGTLQYPGGSGTPVWKLSQWYSQSSLYGATPSTLGSGSYHYANSHKAITIGPTSSSDGHIIFAINGENEFSSVYRGASDPFPHLIVDQRIAEPDGWLGTDTPWLSEMDSLVFNADALLKYHNQNIKSGYDSSIHALQFSYVFLVQNLNPSNAGYGKNMYFLIMLFDDRYSVPQPFTHADLFSGNFIYSVGLTPFSQTGMSVGNWKNVGGDLLPMIKNGLNAAWNNGVLTESTNYGDYKVSLFTMGFECTGMNIGTIQIKNLSLIAK